MPRVVYQGDTRGSPSCFRLLRTWDIVLQGDSGGPVVWYLSNPGRYILAGVISVGIGCGAVFPGINTRVAPYVQWILQNV